VRCWRIHLKAAAGAHSKSGKKNNKKTKRKNETKRKQNNQKNAQFLNLRLPKQQDHFTEP
jgi:hypothetical protein